MAEIHGRLGAVAPSANTDTSLYQAPAGTKATAKVTLCNRGATDTTMRLAYVPGAIAGVASADYLYYDAPLPANSSLPLDALTIAAGHSLLVRFGSASCSASAIGIQEDA